MERFFLFGYRCKRETLPTHVLGAHETRKYLAKFDAWFDKFPLILYLFSRISGRIKEEKWRDVGKEDEKKCNNFHEWNFHEFATDTFRRHINSFFGPFFEYLGWSCKSAGDQWFWNHYRFRDATVPIHVWSIDLIAQKKKFLGNLYCFTCWIIQVIQMNHME